MKRIGLIGRVVLVVGVLGAVVIGVGSARAAQVPPRRCICLDVWAPVICSNGVVYSNSCYASCARATGCVPYGAR